MRRRSTHALRGIVADVSCSGGCITALGLSHASRLGASSAYPTELEGFSLLGVTVALAQGGNAKAKEPRQQGRGGNGSTRANYVVYATNAGHILIANVEIV